jgi:luciferase family oxidoreductase group 1
MKLSILDQSPISMNQTAQDALQASMKLAQVGEKWGYTRYWIAEHHDLDGLACPAPEVMLGYIGANTNTIRIGSGAVLLPYYKPYKVAEIFNLLATLFPGRIDIGIGRAPGGSAEASNALSDHFLQNVWKMPDLVQELLYYIDHSVKKDDATLLASPIPGIAPIPWMLGTSKKSAAFAAENGLAYTFGKFMSDQDGKEIIRHYRHSFNPKRKEQNPYVIVTVSVVCAETKDRAEEIALSWLVWQVQKEKGEGRGGVPSIEEAKQYPLDRKDQEILEKIKKSMIIGCPTEVKNRLLEIKTDHGADEIMIVTITHSPIDKQESYRLIAEKGI